MRTRALLPFVGLMWLVGCGTPTPSPDAGVDASVPFVPTQTRLLGLNDVTWLLPLEALDAGSPFPAPNALIPFASFTRLTAAQPVVRTDLPRLRLVALRFDICDRGQPVPCAEDADGVFRLVLQPVFADPPQVEDVAFHAFFPVPRAEVPQVVDELRALAALQDVPRGSALRVNTAFRTDANYRAKLGALVSRYATSSKMFRMTLFGQETEHATVVWVFRGEELQGGVLQPITIPGIDAGTQEVLLFGGDSYMVTPLVDEPAGFARAVMETSFRNSTAAEQQESVRGLLAIDNPTLHTANTVQCASCHVTTTITTPRASDAGIDVTTFPERFASPTFDLGALGGHAPRSRTMRALGYFNDQPLVSVRVAAESANVLTELETRYPAAQ